MYNKKYNKEMTIVIDDERNQKIVQRRFNTKFKKPRYDPRYYQQEAHDMVLRAHRGIVYIATGGGKTKIMDMLFRTLNCMSLYVINNLTLLDQVADNLEESLGVPIGRMKEGQLDANKQICCVCIDTISAILKRNIIYFF
jgi:superfamily II DNA or RNA helicase